MDRRGLVPLHEAVKSVFGRLVKERDKANEELSETRQALGGFMGPDYRISEEVKKVVATRDMLAARANEAEQKMMLAVSDLGAMTAERDRYKAARDHAYKLLGEERNEHRAVVAERDTLAARVKELEGRLEGARQYVNGLEAWGIKPLPRRAIPADVDMLDMLCNHAKAYIVFEKRDGSGTKVLLKDNTAEGWNGTKERSIDFPAPAIPDPDVREMPFKETGDEVKSEKWLDDLAALNMWRGRAVKCQKTLRNIRAMTGDWSFCIDEDWGADDEEA